MATAVDSSISDSFDEERIVTGVEPAVVCCVSFRCAASVGSVDCVVRVGGMDRVTAGLC